MSQAEGKKRAGNTHNCTRHAIPPKANLLERIQFASVKLASSIHTAVATSTQAAHPLKVIVAQRSLGLVHKVPAQHRYKQVAAGQWV